MTDITIAAPAASPTRSHQTQSVLAAATAPFRRLLRSYTAHLAADPFIVPNGGFARAAN
jgi:hypothetical protein